MEPTITGEVHPTIGIEDEMKKSYLDYAMSVIVSRALPDVRDGLKPVHRRIIYAMKENGYDSSKPYRKSARIVGDVMGKYHPHGDSAIYDAMVRMAQDFSMRLPLIDGQGNFGSMDGDNAAAMRYTEARMAKSAETLIDDIDKDTVDFVPNYDESEREPHVLPARYPNLLVNGAGGIAVGMATNIPPHNLGEVTDACIAYVDNPAITLEEMMEIVPAPDFPTGGLILGQSGSRSALSKGKGSVVMRSRTHFEEIGNRQVIVITEIPYQVNKSRMIERIAEVVREKIVEGIGELRDESDRDGVRVVIELKRDAVGEVVLNQLFKYTPMQTSFGVNMLAINQGRPEMMNLQDIIRAFVDFRENVVIRRTTFELRKARERAHVLAGLLVAISNLDPVINLIRSAKDPAIARSQLMEQAWDAGDVAPFISLIDDPGHGVVDGKYKLSEVQARAILELRLQRLTGMEQEKLTDETEELATTIKALLQILQDRPHRMQVIRGELVEIKDKFATPRRSTIEPHEFEADMEDLIAREDMVLTVTEGGYIKRVPLSTYRSQRRGGKGRSGMTTKEDDTVTNIMVVNTHTPLLFFTNMGMCFQMKVWRLPLGNPQSKGKALVNMLPLREGETVANFMPLPEDEETWGDLYCVFGTNKGNIRRNSLSDFTNIRANGKIAMKFDDSDERIIGVLPCGDNHDIMLATEKGMAIRFPVTGVRVFSSRSSTGVRGIKLASGDAVNSMEILNHTDYTPEQRTAYLAAANAKRRLDNAENNADSVMSEEDKARDMAKINDIDADTFTTMADSEQLLLTVSSTGYGQLASSYDYRITNRGGKGISNMNTHGADVVGTVLVEPELHQIMLMAHSGQVIRTGTNTIRQTSRNSKGVRLFNVDGDTVLSMARLQGDTDDESDVELDAESGIDSAIPQTDGAGDVVADANANANDSTPDIDS